MKIVGKIRDFEKALDLSPAEHRVLELIGKGLGTVDIANYPGQNISRKTVEAHMEQMKTRLELRDMASLRAYAGAYVYHCELFGVKRVTLPESRRRYTFEPQCVAA
jgi:DNA-binding NarL/FixJ family response regulator